MSKKTIREKGQFSFNAIVYGMTVLFIVLALVPLLWALSSSLKDSLSLFRLPPQWIPDRPQSITIILDYSAYGSLERDQLGRDAMKATWFAWKKHQHDPIGEIIVQGVTGGEHLYQANTKSYQFNAGMKRILPTMAFTDALMEVKYPLILEQGYSTVTFYADAGASGEAPSQATAAGGEPSMEASARLDERASIAHTRSGRVSGEQSERIAAFFDETDFLTGQVVSIQQAGDWTRVFDNYLAVLKQEQLTGNSVTVWTHLYNSMFVTGMSILSQLLLGGLTAYALAKMISAKWSARLTAFFVATIFIPEIAVIVPLYLVMEKLSLTNTLWGVILPHTSWGIVIFMFKGFFEQLPNELLQAARMDGAGEWTIFRRIAVPMSIPIFTVVAVMTFLPVWNEFLWPLVILRDDSLYTFSVFMHTRNITSENHVTMAMMIIATVPLILVFAACQRMIEKGVSWSGVKG
ncbi:carbohydrate ABC transporter permease [Paenibacillus sp. 598K]|uniref:carbohydrate ABC transporter permease n=1 Tax=Paenibacillus sp. 598K TaxID=1117987 RepID=UPI000FF9ED7E|nr:carbohydrate ABC transporter permease [Paenibacillus sp. 598K]GBF72541.1 carbohydrate ABC transporter permease [Paenibacillus sp. 598K]